MKKLTAIIGMLALTVTMLAGCGSKEVSLTGSCEDILKTVYEKAELGEDMRGAMDNFQTMAIDESSEEYVLGTTEVDYTDSVFSAPMMSSIAYQCVILRTAEGQDIEAAKEALMQNADPRKWICVEAESVVVENVGDVILYVMADQTTADALKTAFLALNAE